MGLFGGGAQRPGSNRTALLRDETGVRPRRSRFARPDPESGEATLIADLNEVKVPMAVESVALGVDRFLTYIGLHKLGGHEANPLNLALIDKFGLVTGQITSGAVTLVGYAGIGLLLEGGLQGIVKRNSMVKAMMYGTAITETIQSLSTYMDITGHPNNPLNQLYQNNPGTTFALLSGIVFLPAAISIAYQSLKNRNNV